MAALAVIGRIGTVCSSELTNEEVEETTFVNLTFLCFDSFEKENFPPLGIRCSNKLFDNFTKPDHVNALE